TLRIKAHRSYHRLSEHLTWLSFLNSTTWKKMCSKMCLASLCSLSNFGVAPKISPHLRT
ncbi:hypothetical protein GOODEAATRI_014707, partial [Goodea atripinnis]